MQLLPILTGVSLLVLAVQDVEAPSLVPIVVPFEIPLGLPEALSERLERDPQILALGARLFADPILSEDGSVSCQSCHVPSKGFADNEALSPGLRGQRTLRNTPSLLNRALGRSFSWDGQADSLEAQVLLPIVNAREMGASLPDVLASLARDDAYVAEFQSALDSDPDEAAVARVLSAFVGSLLLADSPVDRFRAGEVGLLSELGRTGLWVFESKGGCWRCHSGPNFSDEDFHNTGVGSAEDLTPEGRAKITGSATDRGKFKTPTLRGLTMTAPYMHDGSLATLAEVVEFYRKGGHPNANLDGLLKPLELTDREAQGLVEFLEALSEVAPKTR